MASKQELSFSILLENEIFFLGRHVHLDSYADLQ